MPCVSGKTGERVLSGNTDGEEEEALHKELVQAREETEERGGLCN